MGRKRATLTDLLNHNTARCLYDRARLLALTAHEWTGLPDGVEPRHIEKLLYTHGKAIFFRDPGMSFMCLQTDETGQQNVNGDPLRYRATGFGYTREYDSDDCVIIENNILRLATNPFILFFVGKLTEAERTMDVNIKACKTPVIFACDDKDVLTFKRIFQQVDGNVPAIFADKGLNLDNIQAFMTGVKFLGNELMDYKRSVEADLLTFLGLNNTPMEKRERLITDEANANNELIQSFADLQLEARQRACEAINKMWPELNVSVKRRKGVQNPVETVEKSKEGES